MKLGPSYHRPPQAVRVRQVIECEAIRGRGVDRDPIRRVVQFWSFDGELLQRMTRTRRGEVATLAHPPLAPLMRPQECGRDSVR